MIVTNNDRVIRQLRVTGITAIVGEENIYQGTVFVGEAVRRAGTDSRSWITDHMTEVR